MPAAIGPYPDLCEQRRGRVRPRISEPGIAEDLLQGLPLKTPRATPELNDETHPVRWFYRVLQTAIREAYRRHAAERERRALLDGTVAYYSPPRRSRPSARRRCVRGSRPRLPLKPEHDELIGALDLERRPREALPERLGITANHPKVRRHRACQARTGDTRRSAGCARGTTAWAAPLHAPGSPGRR